MKCPHCLVSFHEASAESNLGYDQQYHYMLRKTDCPACGNATLELLLYLRGGGFVKSLMWPKGIARAPLSTDVPEQFSDDYREACLVLTDSPKASAALSRRCLQVLLRGVAKVKPSDLSREIDEVISSKSLPSHLAQAIDAIRNIGNFAAHPVKSTNTGEVVDVEPGEAEWLLDVLEGLFDFYFVQPAILQKKKDGLNKKLAEAGKPPMK
jgi:hypothetical protein